MSFILFACLNCFLPSDFSYKDKYCLFRAAIADPRNLSFLNILVIIFYKPLSRRKEVTIYAAND